tara:strand:+ start:166 stop:438 length:273 start_codon:yes stop_codon:yes gene_type:complete
MEKNIMTMNQFNKLNINNIKSIINGLKNKNSEQLDDVEKQLITIFYAYQLQVIQMIYILYFYHKFLPLIKTYLWIEHKYKKIKIYFFSFF